MAFRNRGGVKMEIQTVRIEDEKGVGLLEVALEQAYQDGYNAATDLQASIPDKGITDPRWLWEQLMELIGVIV